MTRKVPCPTWKAASGFVKLTRPWLSWPSPTRPSPKQPSSPQSPVLGRRWPPAAASSWTRAPCSSPTKSSQARRQAGGLKRKYICSGIHFITICCIGTILSGIDWMIWVTLARSQISLITTADVFFWIKTSSSWALSRGPDEQASWTSWSSECSWTSWSSECGKGCFSMTHSFRVLLIIPVAPSLHSQAFPLRTGLFSNNTIKTSNAHYRVPSLSCSV